jgi:hypothetical protein
LKGLEELGAESFIKRQKSEQRQVSGRDYGALVNSQL